MAKHIYRGTGAPGFAPREVGHHYIDTLNRDAYISVGTLAASDWLPWSTSAAAKSKAGRLLNSDFTGSPRKGTVAFVSSIATPYAVNITGIDSRVWTVESLTTAGFVINSNAAAGLTGDVFWEVLEDGEF